MLFLLLLNCSRFSIFCILTPFQIYGLQIFIPFHRLSFLIIDYYLCCAFLVWSNLTHLCLLLLPVLQSYILKYNAKTKVQEIFPYVFFKEFYSFRCVFRCSVMSDSLRPHGLQHTRLPCPLLSPRACSNSCPLTSQQCHKTISSSVVPFSSCLQSFLPSGPFAVSQLFASCGQSIGASVSASVPLMNTQGWYSLELTSLISLQSKGLSRVFSNTTVQKH